MGDYRDSAKGYIAFVMLKRNRSVYSFCEYMDAESGEVQSITNHIDPKTGQPVARRFKFTANQPVLKIPIKQKNVIEFLRNSPDCYGSKNARDKNRPKAHCMYAEINDAEDARIANDANRIQGKAMGLVYSLEEYPEKLARIARMVGEDSKIPDIQVLACANYAKSNAAKFIALIEDQDSEVKEMVKMALANGIIKQQGFMYRLGKVHVGSHNENDVVNKISGDPELLEALKMRLDGPEEEPAVDDLPEEFGDHLVEDHESEGQTRATN